MKDITLIKGKELIAASGMPEWPVKNIVERAAFIEIMRRMDLHDALVEDTGGGCSICGRGPVTRIDGTYWLCLDCIRERLGSGSSGTDLERFRALFKGVGLPDAPMASDDMDGKGMLELNLEVPMSEEEHAKIEGYRGFSATFRFTAEGNFLSVNLWE